MPLYEYRGTNRSGKSVKGNIDADNQRNARAKLKKEGIYIQSLSDKNRPSANSKKSKPILERGINVEEMAMFTRQLASLVKANIPLVECLSAVAEQSENPTLKEALSSIRDNVNEGLALNKAMRKYPKIFTNIYVSMVEAGEASGTLDTILLRLAEFTEAQNELNSKVKSAMIYPVIMIVVTLLILAGLFTYIIPQVTQIFKDSGKKLPWYSEIVINISDWILSYWHLILIGTLFVVILFQRWKSSPKGRDQFDALVLKLPVVGKIARLVAISRFTKTLSTLLTGGVPMLQALDIVTNVVDNAVLRDAVAAARDNISEGESIAAPLKKSNEFPPIVIHMIAIGEKTGELEHMLTQVSEAYDFQVKNSIQGLTSILEPIMIVVMGAVVMIIVFAIMVPIFELSNVGGV